MSRMSRAREQKKMHLRDSGVRWLFVPYEHDFRKIQSVRLPTLYFEDPSEVLGIVVTDSLYVVHRYLAEELKLVAKKLQYNDFFTSKMWGKDITCVSIMAPCPYAFPRVVMCLYGCGCTQCARWVEDFESDLALQKICDYLDYRPPHG